MSTASRPTIPFVLPVYQNIDQHLTKLKLISSWAHPSIRTGALVAHQNLLKYKSKAEDNQFYVLGTGKHSSTRYKSRNDIRLNYHT